MIRLRIRSLRFRSPGDETALFNWLKDIRAVRKVHGYGAVLCIHVASNASLASLVELMALFNRYGLSLHQFAPFPRLRSAHQNPGTVPQWWQPKVFR